MVRPFCGQPSPRSSHDGKPCQGTQMSIDEDRGDQILARLSQAVDAWIRHGNGSLLTRWVSRELDAEGVPLRLAITDWPKSLEVLAEARRRRHDWPTGCAEPIAGLVLATLRFARP